MKLCNHTSVTVLLKPIFTDYRRYICIFKQLTKINLCFERVKSTILWKIDFQSYEIRCETSKAFISGSF